jgi:hypothetical protein
VNRVAFVQATVAWVREHLQALEACDAEPMGVPDQQ